MSSLCVHPLRKILLLTRSFQGCKPGHLVQNTHPASLHISCHRTTNSAGVGRPCQGRRGITSGLPLLLCRNGGRTDRLQINLHPPSAPPPAPLRKHRGHHFHTSARGNALPAAVVWLVVKPLQKLTAVILGR